MTLWWRAALVLACSLLVGCSAEEARVGAGGLDTGSLRSPGSTTETQGSTTETQGSTTETHGSTTETHGSTTETHGSTTETHGSTTETHGSTTETQGSSTETGSTTGESTQTARPRPVRPGDLDVTIARGAVDHLAGRIGPREATGRAYRRAAGWVEARLAGSGYVVRRQRFDVPAGNSWGVPVPAGRSINLVATRPGFDPTEPHLVVGAHLDTVPQAPGAEDNASGVGTLLAVAEATADRHTRLPVLLIAFGAEEPRGPTDDDHHHYGSRHYVASLDARERRAVREMVALDRVGVGDVVPVGSARDGDPVQRSLLAAARRAGVPSAAEPGSRSSDHWSFVRAGLPGARLGSTPYAGYHSAADLPGVVADAQLRRTGRIVLAWLAG